MVVIYIKTCCRIFCLLNIYFAFYRSGPEHSVFVTFQSRGSSGRNLFCGKLRFFVIIKERFQLNFMANQAFTKISHAIKFTYLN